MALLPQVSCVVPARLAASRFPGKLLFSLQGEPLILHTLRRAEAANCFAEILCLTDSEKILKVVRSAGFRSELSGPANNGTDRISRNLSTITYDLIVNLQGDEPVFPIEALRLLSQVLIADPDSAHIIVHGEPLTQTEINNRHRCKAGLNAQGQVVDFYRSQPHIFKNNLEPMINSRLQLGCYGYSKKYLRKYLAHGVSELETQESHEMLRNLNLAPIQAHLCHEASQSVDVPQDLEDARALLLRKFG